MQNQLLLQLAKHCKPWLPQDLLLFSFSTLVVALTWHCCLQAPAKDSKQLFLQFAALEETYGLARSAMEVYDKAVRTVIDKERFEVYTLYLARATQFFGVGKVNFRRCRSVALCIFRAAEQ